MKFYALGIGLIFISTFSGCVTSSTGSNPSVRSPNFQQSAQQELSDAWRKYNRQQYHEAIANLLHLHSRYSGTSAGIESRHLLGLCYYQVDGFIDSIQSFKDYLRLAPQGKYAADSKRHIKEISIAYEAKFPSKNRLQSEIASLEKDLSASPQSVTTKLKLADRYWKLGSYARAADLYVAAAQSDPAITRDQTFNERIDLHADGTFTVISPSVQTEQAIEREPVIVTNTNSFKSGRDLFTQERKYYVVGGQVVNRSRETIYGVEVITTIYGFANAVWDTKQYRVGRMYPGETRAFSFRFQNFRNLDDINHYESKVTYQRQ